MKKLYIEIADSPTKREIGLMGRKSLAKDYGMFFKFSNAHHLRFWMKNTYVPLDIAFIDDNGKIIQIEKMYPLSTRAITSNQLCKYALEVESGWFKENEIKVGNYISGVAMKSGSNKPPKIAQVKKPEEKYKKPEEKLDWNQRKNDEDVEGGENLFSNEEEEGSQPPEIEVEGEYPQSVYTEPYQEGEKPEIDIIRDTRGKIKFAEDHNLEMEILYWTKRGHMLPPRRVRKVEGEGYPIKRGPTGELLVAFDVSPTIQGDGWSIKGSQPKSFLLDNIIQLQLLDENGVQLTDEQIDQIKKQEEQGQMQVPQGQQQQQQQQQVPTNIPNTPKQKEKGLGRSFLEKIRNLWNR